MNAFGSLSRRLGGSEHPIQHFQKLKLAARLVADLEVAVVKLREVYPSPEQAKGFIEVLAFIVVPSIKPTQLIQKRGTPLWKPCHSMKQFLAAR